MRRHLDLLNQEPLALDIDREVRRLRARREARRIIESETRSNTEPPEILSLAERLARPRPPVAWRIEGWQPANSRVLLAARRKTGKTTLLGNLARCLVDGDQWLESVPVAQTTGTVALIDLEMSERQLDAWLGDQGIVNADRVVPIPLRGRVSSFDIHDDASRSRWARRLRDLGVEYLIFDPVRPWLDAFGFDEHRDGGRFLVLFDALMAEAGIPDALAAQHMGHMGERSRGDSRFEDWPDVLWRLVQEEKAGPDDARYVSAFGRDVLIHESRLHYDYPSRRLRLVGGSRRQAKTQSALGAVVSFLETVAEPPSKRGVTDALADSGHTQHQLRDAIELGIRLGHVVVEEGGPRGAHLLRLPPAVVRKHLPDPWG